MVVSLIAIISALHTFKDVEPMRSTRHDIGQSLKVIPILQCFFMSVSDVGQNDASQYDQSARPLSVLSQHK